MFCVEVLGDGTVVVANPQPVALDSCVAVLISPGEASGLGFWQTLEISDAIMIGSLVWLLFAVSYGFRRLARLVEDFDNLGTEK